MIHSSKLCLSRAHMCVTKSSFTLYLVYCQKNYLSVSLVRRERLAALRMKQQMDYLLKVVSLSYSHTSLKYLNNLPISVSCTTITRREQLMALRMKHSYGKLTAHNLSYNTHICVKKKVIPGVLFERFL
jgi:hypothetical protein